MKQLYIALLAAATIGGSTFLLGTTGEISNPSVQHKIAKEATPQTLSAASTSSAIHEYTFSTQPVVFEPYPYEEKFISIENKVSISETITENGFCGCGIYMMPIRLQYLHVNTTMPDSLQQRYLELDLSTPEFYDISVYPNPFRDQATLAIDGYDDESYSIEIFDLTGRKTKEFRNQVGAQFTINAHDMRAGIYIYRLVNATQTEVHSGKFIVQ